MLDLHQSRALRLGFDDSRRLAVQEEEVVHPAMRLFKSELSDCDPDTSAQIELVLTLDLPTCLAKLLVDLDTGQRLLGEVAVLLGRSA
jgi:hypothetical protein